MLAAEYPVRLVCRATGWPRSSLYHDAAPAADEGRLRRALARLAAWWPTYGYRWLTAMLRREGWMVNGKRIRRLMAEMGRQGKASVRRRRTTERRQPHPRWYRYPRPKPRGRPPLSSSLSCWSAGRRIRALPGLLPLFPALLGILLRVQSARSWDASRFAGGPWLPRGKRGNITPI
jgi:hypothetical protein